MRYIGLQVWNFICVAHFLVSSCTSSFHMNCDSGHHRHLPHGSSTTCSTGTTSRLLAQRQQPQLRQSTSGCSTARKQSVWASLQPVLSSSTTSTSFILVFISLTSFILRGHRT